MDFPIDEYYDIYKDVMITQKDSQILKINFVNFAIFEELCKNNCSFNVGFPSLDFSEYNGDKSR